MTRCKYNALTHLLEVPVYCATDEIQERLAPTLGDFNFVVCRSPPLQALPY